MKPVIEPDDKPATDGKSDRRRRSESPPKNRESWTSRILVLVALIAIAVLGFGSAAGWFDSTPDADVESNLADARESLDPTLNIASADQPDTNMNPPTTTDSSPVSPVAPPTTTVQVKPPPLNALVPQNSAGLIEECRRVAGHLQNSFPNSLEALEMSARFEYEFGEIELAKTIWEQVVEANPNFVYALRGLGDVATTNGNLKEAVRYFRRAVLVDPNNTARQITLGIALTQAAQLEEAQKVFESVLAKFPDHVGAHAELGSLLLQTQKYQDALTHFEAALSGNVAPADPAKVHFGMVTAYQRTGNREKAKVHLAEHKRLQAETNEDRRTQRQDYADIEAIRIDIARIYVDMSRVYIAGGQTNAAEVLLLRSSQMNPQDVDCRQALAFISMNRGNYFDTIRWLKELSELRPDDFAFAHEIARVYLLVQQPLDSERTLVEFSERHPKQPDVLNALTRFYMEIRIDVSKAIEFGKRTIEAQPTATNFALLSAVYETADQLQAALDALQNAVKLDPSNLSYSQSLALLKEQILSGSGDPTLPSAEGPNP